MPAFLRPATRDAAGQTPWPAYAAALLLALSAAGAFVGWQAAAVTYQIQHLTQKEPLK